MSTFITTIVLATLVLMPAAVRGQVSGSPTATRKGSTPQGVDEMPPRPPGRSTVMGGAIQKVDPVLDQLTLKVAGAGKPIKILFDQRTEVYRDGKRVAVRDLKPDTHASVETILDGTSVFAVSIHVLTQSPEGEAQGQVISFDSSTGMLAISDALSQEPIRLVVPPDVKIVQKDQSTGAASTTSLTKDTLINASFAADKGGRNVVTKIEVLATPGSKFIFDGNLSFLDVHSRQMAVDDTREGQSYKISFDPAEFPESKNWKTGQHVIVTATFDGRHYVANTIKSE